MEGFLDEVWEAELDDKYYCYVERASQQGVPEGYAGTLVVMKGGIEIMREPVALSYGAPFGPDVADIATWQGMIIEKIDEKDTP